MEISGKHVVGALVGFGAVLATIAYLGKPEVRLKPQSPSASPTLAVLPFDNLDGADELEIIAANATVALTDALEGLDGFDVLSRERVLEFVGIPGGAEAIAGKLDADYVLAGSVERHEGRLRLQAYVVMPGDRPRIWADEFFFEEEDAAEVPSRLARQVRDALAGENAR